LTTGGFSTAAAWICGNIGVALIALEAGLRIFGIGFPQLDAPDLDLGWALRPGTEAVIADENKQGVRVRINSDGLRDREHSIAKKPGALRIAVLGDSFAEAVQLPVEKTFWAVLENEMATCRLPGVQEIESINFGVLGYATAHELLTLRHKVWKYSPDIVLLAFFTGNDVRDNSRALSRFEKSPYFIYRDGQLIVDDSFRKVIVLSWPAKLRIFLTRHSRLAEVGYGLYRRHQQEVEYRSRSVERGLDDKVFLRPADRSWQEAWHVTEGLLRQMNTEIRGHGARFWIATLSQGIQVDPDVRKRDAFRKRLGAETLFYPDLRIRDFAEREGIPVVTLALPFAEYATEHHAFLHGFPGALGQGHWNETGHWLAGKIIAARICADMNGISGGRSTR
jgi:hypothetical protein